MSRKATTIAEEVKVQDTAIPEAQDDGLSIPVPQQLALLAVILLLLLGSAITPKMIAFLQKGEKAVASIPTSIGQASSSKNNGVEASAAFSNMHITAKAAYVWDIQNQKALYKKNESDALPLASVTKLMTALIANEVLDKKDPVKINELSIRQDGDSGLQEGEVFNMLTLSDLVLMSSSNDGAFALASAAGNTLVPGGGANSFVSAMNIRAKEIGLSETSFKNPTGLDISTTEGGAYGSARDMAFLMEYIVENEPDILTYTREDTMRAYSKSGQYHDGENTNYYVNEIPGLIGSKTGYTDLAGGNLVVAFNAGLNRPIAAVILGSTQQERFTDMMKLVAETQKYVASSEQK